MAEETKQEDAQGEKKENVLAAEWCVKEFKNREKKANKRKSQQKKKKLNQESGSVCCLQVKTEGKEASVLRCFEAGFFLCEISCVVTTAARGRRWFWLIGTHRKERLGLLFDHFPCCCCLVSRCQKHRSKGQWGHREVAATQVSTLPQANGHEESYMRGIWRSCCTNVMTMDYLWIWLTWHGG